MFEAAADSLQRIGGVDDDLAAELTEPAHDVFHQQSRHGQHDDIPGPGSGHRVVSVPDGAADNQKVRPPAHRLGRCHHPPLVVPADPFPGRPYSRCDGLESSSQRRFQLSDLVAGANDAGPAYLLRCRRG